MRRTIIDVSKLAIIDNGCPDLSLIPKETKTAVYKELLRVIVKGCQQKEKQNKKDSD